MKEKCHEAVSELKWLRLIDKLLFEEINKIEASEVSIGNIKKVSCSAERIYKL
jgi:hypothetical protein